MDDTAHQDLTHIVPRIRRIVARFAAPQDVDDLTQECCVRVIEAERLWDPSRGSRSGWIHSIARNLTFNFLAKRRHRMERQVPLEDPASTSEHGAVNEEQVRWILDQLQRLPEEKKEILKLRYFDGLKTAEIAERLNVTQPTASRRLSAAVGGLRRRARAQGFFHHFLPAPLAGALAGASKMKIAAATALLATSCYVSSGFFLPSDDTQVVERTSRLPGTSFTATLDEPLDAGKSVLWAATVPLAWEELTRAIGEAPRFDPPIETARKLAATPFDRSNLVRKSFVAGAGRIESGIVDELQKQVIDTFGRGRDPVLDQMASNLPKRALITYAFMARDMTFKYAFEAPDRPLEWSFQKDGKPAVANVKWFGISRVSLGNPRHRELVKQVRAEHYESPKDFVIRLLGEENEPDILIARIPPGPTLEATVKAARQRMLGKRPRNVFDSERLMVPKFDFHLTHDFREFTGRTLANAEFRGESLQVTQTIRLRLDEKGAQFRSRVVGALGARVKPRSWIVDGPFLLLMQEKKAAHPFLAIWVGNADLLVPRS